MINDSIMLAVPVSGTYDANIEFNLYEDGKKKVYGYLGLYKNKKICAVGKVVKVFIVKTANGELQFEPGLKDDEHTVSNFADFEVTDDERERFLNFRKHFKCTDADFTTRIFFVDKFYETNYENVGDMGIVGGKKVFLDKLLPATTEEIAAKLNGQTWRLEKGKDIIPEEKGSPPINYEARTRFLDM